MQFLMMCCIDEIKWQAVPEPQRNRIMDEYGKLVAGLKQSGPHVVSAKLNQSSRAVTVRHRNGKPAITDGPFAETKEQLGGYHVIECKDREEASSLATRFPTLSVCGSVEVRAIVPLPYE